MAAVYSTAFISADLTPDEPSASVTVPDGEVWVLRCMDAFITGLAGPANMIVFALADETTFWQALATPPPIQQWFGWRGRQVFESGAGFTAQRGDGTWGFRASGYRLVAP